MKLFESSQKIEMKPALLFLFVGSLLILVTLTPEALARHGALDLPVCLNMSHVFLELNTEG